MKPQIVDLILSPVHSCEVRVFGCTKGGNFAYVGNPLRPENEAFIVRKEKLREINTVYNCK